MLSQPRAPKSRVLKLSCKGNGKDIKDGIPTDFAVFTASHTYGRERIGIEKLHCGYRFAYDWADILGAKLRVLGRSHE